MRIYHRLAAKVAYTTMSKDTQLRKDAAKLIPPLSADLHKGQAGRVAVLGGSKDYTGAPFYSCYSSQRLGADLGHVICDPKAALTIKGYSPDLIVHPIIDSEASTETITKELESLLSRIHVLVIGPGLGREEYMQHAAKVALEYVKKHNQYVVIDADGLWLLSKHPQLIKGYKKACLTPNVVEFGRLCEAAGVDSKGDPETRASELAKALGHLTIIQKGKEDVISNGNETIKCAEAGGLKRCGGQGDVLSGTLGTFLAWGKTYEEGIGGKEQEISTDRIPLLAAWGACTITRTCSRTAFEKMGRSMQTSDMLTEIGKAYDSHFGEGAKL